MVSPRWLDLAYDETLIKIATCDRVDVCFIDPSTVAEATSTFSLGSYVLVPGSGNGDWLIGNGDASGRKLTLSAQSGNNATSDGDANFLAFTVGGTQLMGVIDGDGDSLQAGKLFTIAETDVLEIGDPLTE